MRNRYVVCFLPWFILQFTTTASAAIYFDTLSLGCFFFLCVCMCVSFVWFFVFVLKQLFYACLLVNPYHCLTTFRATTCSSIRFLNKLVRSIIEGGFRLSQSTNTNVVFWFYKILDRFWFWFCFFSFFVCMSNFLFCFIVVITRHVLYHNYFWRHQHWAGPLAPETLNTHILNIVVGCTEIPFFTVRCIQSFDINRKHITLIVL